MAEYLPLFTDLALKCVGGFVFMGVVFKLYQYRRRAKKQKRISKDNPFVEDARRPPPVTKLQPKDKKSAAKNPITSLNADNIEKEYDVICIGSGAGSLVTASILAKTGKNQS